MIRLSESDVDHLWTEVYNMSATGLADYFRDWFEHDWLTIRAGSVYIFIETTGVYNHPTEYFCHTMMIPWSDWCDEIFMVFDSSIEFAQNSLVLYDYDQIKAEIVFRACSNLDLFSTFRRYGFRIKQSDVGFDLAFDLNVDSFIHNQK